MLTYPKIYNLYRRDAETHKLIPGRYAKSEFEYLRKNMWEFTEKIDGTNIRVIFDGKKITFKGRTDKAQIPKHLREKLHEMFDGREDEFRELFGYSEEDEKIAIIFGEGYGNKVQKAGKKYIPDGNSFIVFDVWINGWWLRQDDVAYIARSLNLDRVPVVSTGTLDDAVDIVRNGLTSIYGDFEAEGIVARPLGVVLCYRSGDPITVKIKGRDFK